jgi:hypothetical protein
MKLHSETKKRMEEIMNNLSNQTTIEKSKANTEKKIEKTLAIIDEKEIELNQIDNEISRNI